MVRYKHNRNSGFSIIELMVALSVFTVGVVAIGYLVIDARRSFSEAGEADVARMLAAEGLAAARTIIDTGFDALPVGGYGLSLSEGAWQLGTGTTVFAGYERRLFITEVDEDLKQVISQVTWTVRGDSVATSSYTTYFSNWQQTNGEAGDLVLDISVATTTATGTKLVGINIENTVNESRLLSDMKVSWSGGAGLLGVTIGGTEVFSAATTSPISSGENIDIADYLLTIGGGPVQIDEVLFDGDVSGSNFVMEFGLQDGSKRKVYIAD